MVAAAERGGAGSALQGWRRFRAPVRNPHFTSEPPTEWCSAGRGPGNGSLLALSTSANCASRADITVFLSTSGGTPGSWVYRQPVSPLGGYSALAPTADGRFLVLFERGGCTLSAAVVDPKAVVAAGPQGVIPCAEAGCGTQPLPAHFDGKTGYCKK